MSFNLLSLPIGTTLRLQSTRNDLFEIQLSEPEPALDREQRREVLLLTSPKKWRLQTLGVILQIEDDGVIEDGRQVILYHQDGTTTTFEIEGFEVVDPLPKKCLP